MKKVTAFILAMILVLSLAACSKSTSNNTNTSDTGADTSTSSNVDTRDAYLEQTEALETSGAAISSTQFFSTDNIDPNRKSTANTDERYPELRWSFDVDIVTFSPWQQQMGRPDSIIFEIYEPLFHYTKGETGYELYPVIAKEWEEIDDTHFQVEIYDYVYDTDGNNLTAEDVVAAFETLINAGNANDFAYFVSVEVVDTYTVLFTWTEKVESLTAMANMMETPLYTQVAASEHDLATDPIGTGPYYVSDYTFGATYTLEAKDDYWQKDELCAVSAKRNVQTQILEYIPDSEMAYISFQNGDVATLVVTNTELADFMEGGKNYGKYTLVVTQSAGMNGIGFNMSGNSIMSDINLRLAVAYAIDGAGIANALSSLTYYQMLAEGGPTAIGYVPSWDEDSDNYYHVYDPELAKEYLAQSGYAEAGSPVLTILVGGGDSAKESISQIIVSELESVGINATCVYYDSTILNSYLYDLTYWDMFIYKWAGDFISQMWARYLDKNNFPTGYTQTGIDDEYLQDMIEKIQTTTYFNEENIDAVQQYIIDNCLVYAIAGSMTYSAYDPVIAQCSGTIHGQGIIYGACDYYLD